jgi:uncharacterized protein (DUF2141 family)
METRADASLKDARWKLAWIAALALGVFMVFFRIGSDSLWYDESYSAAAARHPVAEMVPMIAADSHPPLYYLLLRAITLVAGDSEAAVRSLSALGVLALAGLGFFPLRKLWGNRGGLFFSLAILATPMTIAAGREARMYTILAFFVTATVIAGFFALKRSRARDWIALSALTLGAAYTHYYGLIAVAIYWFILLVAVIVGRAESEGGKRLKASIVAALATVALYAPWLTFLVRQAARVKSNFWIPPVDFVSAIHALTYPFMQRFSWGLDPIATALFLAVFGLGAFAAVRAIRSKKEDSFLAVSALATYLSLFAAALVLSVAYKPILYDRYFTTALGLLILVFAYGIQGLRKNVAVAAVLACYALACAPTLARVYAEEVNGPADVAKKDLAPLVKPGDVFVHGSEHTFGIFRYYFPNNEHYLYIPSGFVPFGNHAVFWPNASFGPDLTRYNDRPVTIWYVNRKGEYYTTPAAKVLEGRHRKTVGSARRYNKAPGWLTFTVQEVAYDPAKTSEGSASLGSGTLTLKVEGLDASRGGQIVYSVYTSDPISPDNFITSGAADCAGSTATFSIKDVPFGPCAIFVFHDANKNFDPDFKKGVPTEGITMGTDLTALMNGFSFDDVKFDFGEGKKEQTFRMQYPQ